MKVGILGCAAIAKRYAIPAFLELGAELTLSSRDPEKSKQWAAEFNCNHAESYQDVLDSDVDAVYIPLPIALHEEWILKAAAAGKHIICEKSLTTSYESAKKCVEACKQANVALFENFMCNYHPQHEKVFSWFDQLGKPIFFSGSFTIPPLDSSDIRYNKDLGGGSLNDVGCYPVFMARKFLGEPKTVSCALVKDNYSVDVEGTATLEYNLNNAVAFFSLRTVYQNKYSITSRFGKINVNPAYSIPPDKKPGITFQDLKSNDLQEIEIEPANQFELSFSNFLSNMHDDPFKEAQYDQILSQAKVLEALRLSAAEGRKVALSEI